MTDVLTKTIDLKTGNAKEKRQEILEYFRKTWAVDEQLYTQLKSDEVFYHRGDPLRHVLLFYFGHTAVFFINKLFLAKIIDTRIKGINIFLKRIEDICVASAILMLISPLLLCIAIAIKLNSKGPVFFKQIRYGLNGKPILVYKFRSMSVMENGADVKQAVKNDPRVTKVGSFLRKTSLDEIPQLLNVIKGDMSLIGPRPLLTSYLPLYNEFQKRRHEVRPGITGWAQVTGYRGETRTVEEMEGRVVRDVWYLENWTFFLDLKIIYLTIANVFKGDQNAF